MKIQKEKSPVLDIEPVSTIEILIGDEVFFMLSDIDFLCSWDLLYNSCPWATVYQGRKFVSTWYQIYHKKYLPIVIKSVTGGKLTGLLTLSRDEKGLIVGAGAGQAEYHVWLTVGSDGGEFIKRALFKIRERFYGSDLQFRFIPDKTPLEWTETDPLWKRRCVLQVYYQPLMIIDELDISHELRKKNRKEKINRLKKLGDLKFERITDSQTFVSIFDELATQFDFRKGALYNKTPFRDEPLNKEFLLALFENNLLHVTILKVNDEIIASNVGTIGKKCVHLQGINTHAPTYAKYSPGILHMLMLGKLLAEEDFEVFDLTPGGNSYKDALATSHLPVYELLIAGSLKFYINVMREKAFYSFVRNKKKILASLAKIGVTPKDLKNSVRKVAIVKESIQKAKEQGIILSIAQLINRILVTPKNKVYKIEPLLGKHIISIEKNNLGDLLKYQPKGSKLTKWKFLVNAMERLEKNQHVYSRSEDDLLSCVWVGEPTGKLKVLDTKKKLAFPDGSAILFDIYCHPKGRNNLKDFLIDVTNMVSITNNKNNIYAISKANDKDLCRTLEEAGFIENKTGK